MLLLHSEVVPQRMLGIQTADKPPWCHPGVFSDQITSPSINQFYKNRYCAPSCQNQLLLLFIHRLEGFLFTVTMWFE